MQVLANTILRESKQAKHYSHTRILSPRVRSESAVRPIGTEHCGTGRAFGKSCRIDLVVHLRISEHLMPVTMKFQAATNLSRDPHVASSAAFVYVNRDKNRTVSVRRSIKYINRTNAFPNATGAIRPKLRPRSDHLPNAFLLRSDRSDRTDRRFREHLKYPAHFALILDSS
jgi:hypothetical protein